MTYLLHKPAGLVCARTDRENPTVMSLFPPEQQHLFPVGRLDKYSEGLAAADHRRRQALPPPAGPGNPCGEALFPLGRRRPGA